MVFLPDTRLYFLRHGLAGQFGDPQYKDDSLRPLTAQGKEKMHREAKGIQALGLSFDAILSSPYLRAKQTAEIVAQAFKIKHKEIYLTNNLLPPASAKKLLKELHSRFPRSKNILLVGHEPHLTGLISSLLKSETPLNIELKKGALCCIRLDQTSKGIYASLIWLLSPQQLNALDPDF
jgi:phosphohistidine phosphatase